MDSRFGSSSRSRLVVLWLSGLFCLWQGWCSAQSVVLAWTPSMSPNIVGYNVYYGTVSGQYTNEIPVGDVTNVTVPGLAIGGTYYFAADAVNSSGLESPLSTQTSYSVPEPVLSLSITNLTSGMAVTNSTFTVMGLATDEVGVANVFYSLNGGAYSAVAPNGAQWSVVLRLAAGANVLAIYAVDTLGNISATDTVSIVYTPVATLAVTTKGEGSVSPNYNGAVLQVGRLYTMTATPTNGCAFINWTGGIFNPSATYTNRPTVQFVMASNLVMEVNFVDTNKPFLSITNVTRAMEASNADFTVMGIATDNIAVSNVQVSLNGASYARAALAGNAWSAALTLAVGTNIIKAYATDGSENVSATNTASIDYVETSPLIVKTSGKGNVGPNYNGQRLRIGQRYAMRATAGSRFIFTNWTAATNGSYAVYTTSPTVQFIMVTNLVLQANFQDRSVPYLAITNAKSGMLWTNPAYTVMGLATDDEGVATVNFSLNGAPYGQAIINGIHWNTAQQPLKAGTNVFSVYARATNGNFSATDKVDIVYAVSNTLMVVTNGNGVISPDYNGKSLRIGENYSMTARAAKGFMFTNWSAGPVGGIPAFYSNKSTVLFAMASNLEMQANFVDINKPFLSITNVKSGMLWTNAAFTVMGKATDNVAVAAVYFSLNNSGWSNVVTANNWASWQTNITLHPGTNTLAAYAVDTSGNLSATDRVSLDYVVTNQLLIETYGLGTLSPNYSNVWLRIGQNYKITASPARGFKFAEWVTSTNFAGGTTTNKPTVQFTMASNLTLQAIFAETARPTLRILSPTSGAREPNTTATLTGTASDFWGLAMVAYQLNGGPSQLASSANAFRNWTANVQLNPGTNFLSIYAMNLGGIFSTTNKLTLISTNAVAMQFRLISRAKSGAGFNFTVRLTPGLSGRIQVSTNLINWNTLTNFAETNGIMSIYDPEATRPQRFYRVVAP